MLQNVQQHLCIAVADVVSSLAHHCARCHCYFIGGYNERVKQDAWGMVGTEAAEAAF